MNTSSNDIAPGEPMLLVIARWVIGSIGIIANSFVIFVFVYNKTYKKSLSLKLLLHQTVVDLIGSLIFLILYNIEVPDGTAGTIFCKMEFFFFYASATSTYNFVLLTVERYIAVVHPLLYRQKSLSGKITYLSLISPHVCGVLIMMCLPIFADVSSNEKKCTLKEMNAVVGILLILCQFLLPICIMLYCYVKMLIKIRKTRIVNHRFPIEFQPSARIGAQRFKSDLITTLILIACVYVVTVSPIHVVMLVHFLCGCLSYIFMKVGVVFLDLNLTINPFIYCMACKDFQRGLHKLRDAIFQTPELETQN
ncbi:G-protein coupled receptor 183-like [Anneissia japonica]|uniref:G-protein coupled receptor 183-like n=1 Tax=Anneissia japonica TaxID=1529436 RepID=UPI0014254CE6|nr:G-protein coupled receptor 183-like [Anneissia japonica]